MIYKKSWKYILIKDNSYLCSNDGYYRPKALKNFLNISKNDIGGFVMNYHNISQKGDCWVYKNAHVSRNARVTGNITIGKDRKVIIIGKTWLPN